MKFAKDNWNSRQQILLRDIVRQNMFYIHGMCESRGPLTIELSYAEELQKVLFLSFPKSLQQTKVFFWASCYRFVFTSLAISNLEQF